ncbi:MAG: NgoFVII family restriction endonuclease [Spirochaetaceae bacterium]|nr:NgoFVII family restriction endonuclease [Spirochaetaceae bacterium]
MIYSDLYNEVLIKPCMEGANILKIISGYATSSMAFDHLEELHKHKLDVQIKLHIGMCPSDGLSFSNHNGFQSIVNSDEEAFRNRFLCSYIYKVPPIHSKLYVWYRGDDFYKAFIGSANYTQNAFFYQREVLAEIHDTNIDDYLDTIETDSIFCNLHEAESLITIHNDSNYYKRHLHEDYQAEASDTYTEIEHVLVPLYSTKTGDIQNRGGLNWGQRPGREKNQAYIQLPKAVYTSDFFPPAPQSFNVVTDDDKSFLCRRAEKTEEGSTLHTPQNNSFLGEYFRNRLGLANGAFVTKQDLERYGRTDVEFYKIGDEYYMDFHV